jgi:hypothetical protein
MTVTVTVYVCMYVCMYNVRTKGRMSQGLGFMVRNVWSHIYLTKQCMYVCMVALTEVGTSYMAMKEGMSV